MSRGAVEVLEFAGLREIVRGYATCAPGRAHVESLAPAHGGGVTGAVASEAPARLAAAYALIGEAVQYLRAGHDLGFGALADPAAWLPRLEVPGAVLAPGELLDAASLVETAAWLRQVFRESPSSPKAVDGTRFPRLQARTASLADMRHLAKAIRAAVLPNGEISDDASPQLKRIRQSLARTRDEIQKKLRSILRARGMEQGADYVTLRSDRFVIPVRAGDKRQVPGVVHGSSGTGQTLFVEPLDTIEMNNRMVQLGEDEAAEIARILAELTDALRSNAGPLRAAAETIAEMDSTFARARFAREFDCVLPAVSEGGALRLEDARHPVLEHNLRRQGRAIVPMSLALGGGETVLVISGPNTGGKTVALKTVGLAALSAAAGIPVAAQRAELPLFDRVLADIGDEQSITTDLSTFSAHMTNLRTMLTEATAHSLVLVDEMGTGTAPEEGAALAVALLEEFRARRCLTIATTHHDRLKTYASATPGVLNAAVEFDAVALRPTYRLVVGVPGVSSGIQIAERLGLPAAVLERARAEMSPQAREAGDLIAWLHRSRDELEQIKREAAEQVLQLEEERRKLRSEWVERQRARLAELEKQFAATLKQYEAEIKRLVGEIEDKQLRAQMEKSASRRISKLQAATRDEANAAAVQLLAESQRELVPAAAGSDGAGVEPVRPEQIMPGAEVQVRGFKQPVMVRQFDGRTAEVQAGPLRMKIALADIVAIVGRDRGPGAGGESRAESGKGKGKGESARRSSVEVHAESGSDIPEEINVIGKTVEEATELVDKFLDNAALAGKARLRIIHGHGTGALRRGLAEFLKTHPLVQSIAAEDAERGGNAITIVELRG
jgi:DNA mismatch repair protein MutS2